MKWLVGAVLDWVLEKFLPTIIGKFQALIQQAEKEKEIDQKVQKQAEKLKRSETDAEDEAAARDILSRRK